MEVILDLFLLNWFEWSYNLKYFVSYTKICWREKEIVHAKWSCHFHNSQPNSTTFVTTFIDNLELCPWGREWFNINDVIFCDVTTQWGQTTVHPVSCVCYHLAHWHIPDTDHPWMPLGWHGMLVGFLAKLLAGLRQVLAAWRAGLVVVSTVRPFRPTRARLATNRGTSRAKTSSTHVWENSWWDARRVV